MTDRTSSPGPTLIRPRDARRILKCSAETLRMLGNAGRIKKYRRNLSKSYSLYDQAEVEAFGRSYVKWARAEKGEPRGD